MPASESRWIVDDSYLLHIKEEIKKLKGVEPKDRLDMQAWIVACAAMMATHMNSSLSLIPSMNAVVSGMLENISEEEMRELFEDYRKLAIHLLKVDDKLTRAIPSSTKELVKQQAQSHVTTNPLVS